MDQRLLPYRPERDVYRLLGVPPNADADEIVVACRRLALTFHPDRNMSERATQEMQVINAVRQTMTDPQLRALYDRERWRFHARTGRVPAVVVREWEPTQPGPQRPAPSTTSRYVRAVMAGLGAALSGLLPPRCRTCRAVLAGEEDVYCAACGTPRLTTGD